MSFLISGCVSPQDVACGVDTRAEGAAKDTDDAERIEEGRALLRRAMLRRAGDGTDSADGGASTSRASIELTENSETPAHLYSHRLP